MMPRSVTSAVALGLVLVLAVAGGYALGYRPHSSTLLPRYATVSGAVAAPDGKHVAWVLSLWPPHTWQVHRVGSIQILTVRTRSLRTLYSSSDCCENLAWVGNDRFSFDDDYNVEY